jgi:hypothetical protein
MPTRIELLSRKKPKSYFYVRYPEIPYTSTDLYVSTVSGDRLDLLAHQFLGDVDYWWIISTANPDIIRRDSFILDEGLEIRIPSNLSKILDDFEKINKL